MRAPALGAQCFSLRQKMTLPLFYIIHIIFEIGLFDCFTQAEALRSQCVRHYWWTMFIYLFYHGEILVVHATDGHSIAANLHDELPVAVHAHDVALKSLE